MLHRSTRLLRFLAVFMVAAEALANPARAQEVTLKLHHFLPALSPFHAHFMAVWADKVMKESNGRIKIQLYPSMQLGGTPPQLYDQVKDGVADIIWTVAGYSAGRFPAFEVFELPFMVNSAAGSSRALWEYVHVNNLNKTEFKDVKLLAVHQHDEPHFHMVNKPIRTLADLKGVKIRAPTRITNRLLTALGATPVGMPVTQVSDALSKGVIDGALLPWEVVPSIKVHELVKYHSEIDVKSRWLYSTVFVFAMNPAKFASLPGDLKKIIDANSGAELSSWVGKMADESAIPSRKQAVDRKNTFNTISIDELKNWQKVAQTVTDDWIKDLDKRGLDGKALVNSARELIAKYDKKK
ncbi:MAG: TRAP transporter substrate-binding protein [Burkholderiales bacterium]